MKLLKLIYTQTGTYRFRTVFGNYVYIRVEEGMYIIEQEEEKYVPERKWAKYMQEEIKPSWLALELLRREDLDPEEKYYIFKQCTFGKFTAPILDPQVKNVNINDRTCMITHDVGDLLYAMKYEPSDVEKVKLALERELERTCTLTNPILEGSVTLLDYIMRISVTGRGLGVAPMTQISIRKHRKIFYTLIDQIKTNFVNTVVGALLALNWALPVSMSQVVCGVMGTRKTSLLGCLIQFVEPNCIVGIIQDDPELDIRELPGMYIEWHCARHATSSGVREIKLLDLIRAALRKNYRKIVIAEVRSPEEIYAYIQLLKVTYGAATTIHAMTIEALEKRLLSAHWEGLTVDKYDLESIRLGTFCGFVNRKPKVISTYYLDFVRGVTRPIFKFEKDDWIFNDEVVNQYLNDLADLNNVPVSEVRQLLNDLHRFLEFICELDLEVNAYTLRQYLLELYRSGFDTVKEMLLEAAGLQKLVREK